MNTIKDFIRHIGNAIFAMFVIGALFTSTVIAGLAAVRLVNLVHDIPEGWDVAVVLLVAAVLTIEERIG